MSEVTSNTFHVGERVGYTIDDIYRRGTIKAIPLGGLLTIERDADYSSGLEISDICDMDQAKLLVPSSPDTEPHRSVTLIESIQERFAMTVDADKPDEVLTKLTNGYDRYILFKENLCEWVRDESNERGLNLCEEGIEEFCSNIGVDYTSPKANRRGVIFFDLDSDSFENHVDAVERAYAAIGEIDGINWGHASVDEEDNGGHECHAHPDGTFGYVVVSGSI